MSDLAALIGAKPASAPPIDDEDRLIGIRHICQWRGICSRTVDRWLANPSIGFPKPAAVVNGRRYWRVRDVLAWEKARETASAA